MKKIIWRKNFEGKRMGLLLPLTGVPAFYDYQDKTFGKKLMNNMLWVNEGFNCLGAYFDKYETSNFIDIALDRIINQTNKIDKLHRYTIEKVRVYFGILRRFNQIDFAKSTAKELKGYYDEIFKYQPCCHGLSVWTTWFVDSDGEDLTNYLINYVKNQIEKYKFKDNFAEIFPLLTTPTKDTLAQIETKESLKILQSINKNLIAKKLFLSKNISIIEEGLDKLDSKLRNKIINHYKKWRWMPYGYLGPEYDLDYYLEIWSSLLRQKVNINRELNQLSKIHQENKILQNKFFKKFNFDSQHKAIFKVAQQIVWLKAYRKDAMFYSCCILEKIQKEIAKRFDLSFNQARYLTKEETHALLAGKNISIDQINQRLKFFIFYLNNSKINLLVGKKAKAFLTKQRFEKIKIVDVQELLGTCACIGKAKGVVRLIDVPEEMYKMNKGDIMVSHTTFPSLVPAMKKASAIITDDGGLTCHAAIVARELKKPCIVGVKIATQVLKDGDLVEVDATRGLIKKI